MLGKKMKKWQTPIAYCKLSGKIAHDKKGAQTARNAARKWRGAECKIYPCPYCHFWHLTSKGRGL